MLQERKGKHNEEKRREAWLKPFRTLLKFYALLKEIRHAPTRSTKTRHSDLGSVGKLSDNVHLAASAR